MAAPIDPSEYTRQVSEHAYALWIEAATLTSVAKETTRIDLHPLVLLANRCVEVCRLAQQIHKTVRDGQTASEGPRSPVLPTRKSRSAKKERV